MLFLKLNDLETTRSESILETVPEKKSPARFSKKNESHLNYYELWFQQWLKRLLGRQSSPTTSVAFSALLHLCVSLGAFKYEMVTQLPPSGLNGDSRQT